MVPQKDNILSFFIAFPRAVALLRSAAAVMPSGFGIRFKTIRAPENGISQRACEAIRKAGAIAGRTKSTSKVRQAGSKMLVAAPGLFRIYYGMDTPRREEGLLG
jgi:hypothetical protein